MEGRDAGRMVTAASSDKAATRYVMNRDTETGAMGPTAAVVCIVASESDGSMMKWVVTSDVADAVDEAGDVSVVNYVAGHGWSYHPAGTSEVTT